MIINEILQVDYWLLALLGWLSVFAAALWANEKLVKNSDYEAFLGLAIIIVFGVLTIAIFWAGLQDTIAPYSAILGTLFMVGFSVYSTYQKIRERKWFKTLLYGLMSLVIILWTLLIVPLIVKTL